MLEELVDSYLRERRGKSCWVVKRLKLPVLILKEKS